MTDKVSVGVSASPDQVLAAFKRIQDAAKATGRDIKSMADISFPGLEDAEKTLREFQRGFDQMMSSAVAGRAAQSLRSGVTAGLYSRDPVSWLMNSGRQFPDDKAREHHMQSVMQQAANLARFQPPGGGGGGGGEAGGTGAMMSGMLPMMKGLLPLLGIGTGLAYIAKKAGDGGEQATQISDLRRSVGSLDETFYRFRDNVQKASEGLGLTYTETTRLAQEYSRLSGAMNSSQAAAGTHEGAALARMFGMDPSRGVGLVGRAGMLGVGGNSPSEQAKLLAEAMVRSNLGGRQAEAAEAMIRFGERNAQMTGEAGNMRGFMEMFSRLTGSGSVGMRANAESIIGGYDSAMRHGGNAGDAGKAFLYSILADMGIRDPFKAQKVMEGGFFADIGGGKQFGPEAMRKIIAMSGGNNDLAAARMSGLFGGSMTNAGLVLDAFQKAKGDTTDKGFLEVWKKLDAEMKKGDIGAQFRQATADLDNSLTKLIGEKVFEPLSAIRASVAKVAQFTDSLGQKMGLFGGEGSSMSTANKLLTPGLAPFAMQDAMTQWLTGKKVNVAGTAAADPTWMGQLRGGEKELGIPGLLWGIYGAESSFGKDGKTGKNGIFQLTDIARQDLHDKFGMDIDPLDKYSALRGATAYAKLKRDELQRLGIAPTLENVATAYNSGTAGLVSGQINDPEYAHKVARLSRYKPEGADPVKVEVTVSGTVEGELLDPNRTAVGKIRLKPRISPPTMAPVPQ